MLRVCITLQTLEGFTRQDFLYETSNSSDGTVDEPGSKSADNDSFSTKLANGRVIATYLM